MAFIFLFFYFSNDYYLMQFNFKDWKEEGMDR